MGERKGELFLIAGFSGLITTLFLAFNWVPSVNINAFESPEAQRIFYWHVPAAWAAFISFSVLFTGSAMWLFKRNELGWKLHIAGSEAGLACGLIAVWSGCVWGAAEWGTPWDWQDYRLNSFALLTLLAVFLVLGRRSQPDGVESRDTFATFGFYGFVLVPFTYLVTRIWVIRHPGPIIAGDDASSISLEMRLAFYVGVISFTLMVIGHIITSIQITRFEQRINRLQRIIDGE